VALQTPGQAISWKFGPGFSYLAGKNLQLGNFPFTLKVTDAANTVVTQSFIWYIGALDILSTNLPIAGSPLVTGSAYTQPLLAIGGGGVYTWTNTGPMPPGLTLSGSGVVGGTPASTGFFSVPIHVADGDGNGDVHRGQLHGRRTARDQHAAAEPGRFPPGKRRR